MTTHPILILGGTGKTGRRIADRLEARGVPCRRASRAGTPPFAWDDARTWPALLRDVRAAYITYAPDLAIPGAADHVRRFAEAAAAQGVERLVLLAGRGEPQVAPAVEAVQTAGPAWTVLEAAFFCQNFSEGLLVPHDDAIVFPAGDVGEPFVDVDDIADVAVAALTAPGHAGKTYDLTGPRVLTFADAAAELAAAHRRPIHYVPVSFEAYADLLAPHLPPAEVAFFVALFRTLLDGHNAHVGDGVARALGRPPRDFRAFARALT